MGRGVPVVYPGALRSPRWAPAVPREPLALGSGSLDGWSGQMTLKHQVWVDDWPGPVENFQ